MTLRMKRNLPLIIFLFGFLFSLVFFYGNQQVNAYSLVITTQPTTSADVVVADQPATISHFDSINIQDGSAETTFTETIIQ
jgi:hypothetical protein